MMSGHMLRMTILGRFVGAAADLLFLGVAEVFHLSPAGGQLIPGNCSG